MSKLPWERKGFYNSELPPDPMEETEFIPRAEQTDNNPPEPEPGGEESWDPDLIITETSWEQNQAF